MSEDRARALALTPVSAATAVRLDKFVALLIDWQAHTNLIAASTVPTLWTRHIADSLQLLPLAPPDAKIWVDFGAGAGFPGMVIACALADTPGARVHLVESRIKKANFLREAAAATGAPVEIHAERAEDCGDRFAGRADVVTARALASLTVLCGYARPLIQAGAVGLFPKGQDVGVELTKASKYWNIKADLVPSVTSADSRIVRITALQSRQQQARK